ncbi:response regulator [Paenibacillus gansuensis]|uniref:Response regulator n=1 Tax=Paenibacillus gansuensis TaxID=306542 RepID=A0ABW5P8S9_9BACL
MYQLLIVDDEEQLADGLAEAVPWEEIGIKAVYKAYSAKKALEWMDAVPIDIVITDIRMPGMSGLELLQEIRNQWSRTRVVLLTGYSEFDYAKQAVQSKAADYLLKPVRERELMLTVGRITEELTSEWKEILSHQQALQALRANLPLLRGRLLAQLLQGRKYDSAQLEKELGLLELPFRADDLYSMMLLRMEDDFAAYDSAGLSLMEYAVENIVQEVLGEHFMSWSCRDHHGHLIFLIRSRRGPAPEDGFTDEKQVNQQLDRMISQMYHHIRHFLKGKVSFCLGKWERFPSRLSAVYQEALSQLRRTTGEDDQFLVKVEEPLPARNVATLQSLYEPPLLLHLVEMSRWDEAETKIFSVLEELAAAPKHSPEHLQEAYFAMAGAFLHMAHKTGRTFSELVQPSLMQGFENASIRTVAALREWALTVLSCFRNSTAEEYRDRRMILIRQVQCYVEKHLADSISLQSIADHVYMHPTHLSKVYKAETGEGLSEYMYRLRMEKAAFLLQHTNDRIYEIGIRVGYVNANYFIKIFRKYYQMTPQEYREVQKAMPILFHDP